MHLILVICAVFFVWGVLDLMAGCVTLLYVPVILLGRLVGIVQQRRRRKRGVDEQGIPWL